MFIFLEKMLHIVESTVIQAISRKSRENRVKPIDSRYSIGNSKDVSEVPLDH